MTLAPGLPPILGEGSLLWELVGRRLGSKLGCDFPEDQLGSLRPSDWRWQGVQGQSAWSQQRGLSLLAGQRLALVKSGMGCCLAAIVPTPTPI